MAINKKLINFAKKSNFDTKLANGEIPNTSIVFIDDTQQIWTHNTFFPTDNTITILPVHTNIQKAWPDLVDDTSKGSHTHGTTTYSSVPDAAWLLSGTDGYLSTLGSGSYLIQISHSTDSDGGIYTGYFSYTTGSGTDEEISLHRSGNALDHTSSGRLFAKIKYISGKGTYLLLASTTEESDCTELTIKMKKLL